MPGFRRATKLRDGRDRAPLPPRPEPRQQVPTHDVARAAGVEPEDRLADADRVPRALLRDVDVDARVRLRPLVARLEATPDDRRVGLALDEDVPPAVAPNRSRKAIALRPIEERGVHDQALPARERALHVAAHAGIDGG